MKKLLLLLAVAMMTVSLQSCRETTQQESEEAVEEIGRDIEAGAEEAARETEAAAEEVEAEVEAEVNETDDM